MRRDTHIVKTEKVPTNLALHSALHNETFANGSRRYQENHIDGGFCEVKHTQIKNPLIFIYDENLNHALGIIRPRMTSKALLSRKNHKNNTHYIDIIATKPVVISYTCSAYKGGGR